MTASKAIEVLEYCGTYYEDMNFGAPKIALDMAISALEEVQALRAENAELHCELQAQNALLSGRDAAIEADAIARFVNWVDDHYNTEIHLERTDEYKTIHDFYEEFMGEQQERERD